MCPLSPDEKRKRDRDRKREKLKNCPELREAINAKKRSRYDPAKQREKYRRNYSKEKQRERKAKYRAQNKERVNAYGREYYQRNREYWVSRILAARKKRNPTIGLYTVIHSVKRGDMQLSDAVEQFKQALGLLRGETGWTNDV